MQAALKHPLLFFCAGALAALGTVLPHLALLTVLSLAPFFVLLHDSTASQKSFLFPAYVYGLGFFAVSYAWAWGVYPLRWIGIEPSAASLLIIAGAYIVTVSVLAVSMVARAWAARLVVEKFERNTLPVVAVVWVAFEIVAAVLFEVLWSGSQGLIGGHWSFGFLGYALAEVPFVRLLAGIGGVYLLSFVVVYVAGIAFWWWKKRLEHSDTIGIALLCALMLIWTGYIYATPDVGELRIAAFRTYFTKPAQDVHKEDLEMRSSEVGDALEQMVASGLYPDLVLFPEGSAIFNYLPEERQRELHDLLSQHTDTLILNPANRINEDKKLTSSIWYLYSETQSVQRRQKDMFVPVGEYEPYIASFIGRLLGFGERIDNIYKAHEYHRVADEAEASDKRVGALQCSEILSPTLYRYEAQQSMLLANLASHASFSHPFFIRQQTIKMARLHATANDRYFIQAGNIAPALVVSNKGALLDMSTVDHLSALYSAVELRDTQTPYTRWGIGVYALLAALVLVLMLLARRSAQRWIK